ncbi:MAG: pyridoxamine 5'-phosphate oxidase, partial [Roseiflexaceae bacterium]
MQIHTRKDYTQAGLNESDVAVNPIDQFTQWLTQAMEANMHEPYAMTLATVDADNRPSARVVLLRGVDARGFVFFTNYESRKGQALAAYPLAALLFYWPELERQVRIEGVVHKIDAQESDAYFHSRPLGSRLGAWASPQSQTIPNRDTLEARLAEASARYGEQPPRPPFWGGYRVQPDTVEFWQGRPSRLHDRLVYTLVDGVWQMRR